MSELFIKVLNMSISAGWIVLAVLILRFAIKKAPKWISVLLWGIVALRLVCPISIESVLSLIPSSQTVSPNIMMDRHPGINSGVPVINDVVNPIISGSFTPDPAMSVNPLQIWIPIFSILWLIGIAAMLIYTVISYLKIKSKVKTAVRSIDNIYQSENVVSPFVLGVIKPKIYLPYNISEQNRAHVISHEEAHIKRKDHLWKPIGFLILTLHWFNPLMWLAYVLLCKDIELACDEKVVKDFSSTERADYSEALLSCTVNRRIITACPLAFGEVGVKTRVKGVLNYKKPAFWIIILAVVALVFTAVFFLTDPKSESIELDNNIRSFLDAQVYLHHNLDKYDGDCSAVSYSVMEMSKNGGEITLYAWILYNKYDAKFGEINTVTSSHIPTVITVKELSNKSYELLEYWTPRDGSYYGDDIRGKFPQELWDKAFDSQSVIDKQKKECQKTANDYYSALADQRLVVSQGLLTTDSFVFKNGYDRAMLTLGKARNECSFSLSMLSSYFPYGTYEKTDECIIMKTDDGKNTYTFKIEKEGLVFDASRSSPVPSYAYQEGAAPEISIPDGAVFEPHYPDLTTISYDREIFDIDNDGTSEVLNISYGKTSGLFTFIISVSKDGNNSIEDSYSTEFYESLSFEVINDNLFVQAITENNEIRLYEVGIKNGHTELIQR